MSFRQDEKSANWALLLAAGLDTMGIPIKSAMLALEL